MASTPADVRIPRSALTLAGHLYRPDRSDASGALVIATPGSSVKEQIAANYARRLAELGWVVLTFDPAYQGQSDGEPRDLEDPHARVDDVRYAVDYLAAHEHVDTERIGAVGVCAGGGYAVTATMTDHRIKALATVVPVNVGRAFRQADTSPGAVPAALDELGRQRTAEVRGGEPRRNPWLPDTLADAAGITDPDVLQAIRFYRTPRGYDEHSTNRRHSRSDALLLGYDAFHLVGELLTQPLQVIVGGRLGTTGSYYDGLRLWELAPNGKDFLVVDGAGHYEMYDEPRYVEQAVARLDRFFSQWLA